MADSTTEQVISQATQTVSQVQDNDLSFKILGEIFGNGWTDTIQGIDSGRTQLLLNLLSTFNSIALSAISIIMFYIILRGVLGAGTEGSPFGKNVNGFMGLLRSSYGTFLVVPVPGTGGLAVVQVIILTLVLQSINLANFMNDNIVKYFQGEFVTNNGNAGYSKESSVLNPASMITESQLFSVQRKIITPIIYSSTIKNFILEEKNIYNSNKLKNDNSIYALSTYEMYKISEPVQKRNGTASENKKYFIDINFYGFKIKESSFFGMGPSKLKKVKVASLSIPCIENADKNICSELKESVKDLIKEVDQETKPIVKKIIVDTKKGETVDIKKLSNDISKSIYQKTKDFSKVLRAAYINIVEDNSKKSFKPFKNNNVEGGWMTAGTYYWVYSRMLSEVSNLYDFKVVPTVIPFDKIDGIDKLLNSENSIFSSPVLQSDLSNINNFASKAIYNPKHSKGFEQLYDQVISNVEDANNASIMGSIFTSIVPRLSPSSFGKVDPIIALNSLGKTYFSIATLGGAVLWAIYKFTNDDNVVLSTGKKVLKTIAGPAGTAWDVISNLFGAYSFMILTSIAITLLAMFIAALVYIFYLPLIPTLMWLGEMIKWIMFVIQSVFAGPVWAVSHVNIEGQGLTGERAKQGYMLLINILLRPSLLLAGLIVSMIMLRVLGIMLSIILLPSLLYDMSSGGQTSDSSVINILTSLSDIILFPFYLIVSIIFTVIVAITWIHRIFDMSFNFADDVMRWAGNSLQIGERASSSEDKGTFVGLIGNKIGGAGQNIASSGKERLAKGGNVTNTVPNDKKILFEPGKTAK